MLASVTTLFTEVITALRAITRITVIPRYGVSAANAVIGAIPDSSAVAVARARRSGNGVKTARDE